MARPWMAIRDPLTYRFSASLVALSAGVIGVHGRQVPHLLLGDVEPDAVHDPGDGANRDGHLPAAKQMPLLQQHVAYVVVARVDDKPLDSSDLAVGGIDALIAAHCDLARRQGAVGACRLIFPGLGHTLTCDPAVLGQHEHLFRTVARVLVQVGSRHEIRILGKAELVELRPGAAQPDLLRCRGINKVERHNLFIGSVPRSMLTLVSPGRQHLLPHRHRQPPLTCTFVPRSAQGMEAERVRVHHHGGPSCSNNYRSILGAVSSGGCR